MYQIKRNRIIEFEVDTIVEELNKDRLPIQSCYTAGNLSVITVQRWIKVSHKRELLPKETAIERWHRVRLRNAVEAFNGRNAQARCDRRRRIHPWMSRRSANTP